MLKRVQQTFHWLPFPFHKVLNIKEQLFLLDQVSIYIYYKWLFSLQKEKFLLSERTPGPQAFIRKTSQHWYLDHIMTRCQQRDFHIISERNEKHKTVKVHFYLFSLMSRHINSSKAHCHIQKHLSLWPCVPEEHFCNDS